MPHGTASLGARHHDRQGRSSVPTGAQAPEPARGPLVAEFAGRRVRPAEGEQRCNRQHVPGDEAWLVGERRATGEHKYYLSDLPVNTPLEILAATLKARWVCEQAHQQTNEELGLDHVEGRSWTGLHRQALMTMI